MRSAQFALRSFIVADSFFREVTLMVNPEFEVDRNIFPVCRTVRSAARDTKQSPAPVGTPVGSGRKVYVLDSKLLASVRERTALREMEGVRM